MKTKVALTTMVAAFSFATAWALQAQTFSSGSDGSYGPMIITNNTTLDMPADGVFHCTTISVANGVTLRFIRNSLNTPVFLLATGNVFIAGTVDVSGGSNFGRIPGKGGPGGFDGGFGAFGGYPDGDGQGPGGGRAGNGTRGAAFGTRAELNTNLYGNTLLNPLIGGSGGAANFLGCGRAGGGGGGAILIASSSEVNISGVINADSGHGGGGGSGGAIRVVAPVVAGSGSLSVFGGYSSCEGGVVGRTRIDSLDRFAHRNLSLGGYATRGSQMFVFSPNSPRLNIIEVAGQTIPEGTTNAASISLPVGASTTQTVRVQARNFTNDVPITVAITPENAPSARFFGVITNTGNPSIGQMTVTLPVDTVCYLHVWTR